MPLDDSPAAVLTLDLGQLMAATHPGGLVAPGQVSPVAVLVIVPLSFLDDYFCYLCPSLNLSLADPADDFRPYADSDGDYAHNYQQCRKHVGNYWQNVQIQGIGNSC